MDRSTEEVRILGEPAVSSPRRSPVDHSWLHGYAFRLYLGLPSTLLLSSKDFYYVE
jgi:hypothetical protein